jgi:hypothetical protein
MLNAREVKEIQELADKLSRFINGNSQECIQKLADTVLRDHRTLQQQTFGFFLICIRKWAALGEHGYDLRNAWTVQVCKQIVDWVEDAQYQPPLI